MEILVPSQTRRSRDLPSVSTHTATTF